MFNTSGSNCRVKPLVRGGISLLLLVSAAALIQIIPCSKPVAASHFVLDGRIPGGSLVIAGGGYVAPEVRQRFFELAGGSKARIVVVPATDPVPGTEDSWVAPWKKLGVTQVDFCNAHDRATANTAEFCDALSQATGVWFSGGYQDLLADRYVDTNVQKCLREVLHRNGVIGGCSAGAAILSRVMIKEGEMLPVEGRGLDLIPDVIVDQHFLQRNRLWRMQQMLEAHPTLVGLGVDENTALIYEMRAERMTVVGESYAVICLPPSGTHSSRIEILKPGDDVLLSRLRKEHFAYQPPVKMETHPTQLPPLHSA